MNAPVALWLMDRAKGHIDDLGQTCFWHKGVLHAALWPHSLTSNKPHAPRCVVKKLLQKGASSNDWGQLLEDYAKRPVIDKKVLKWLLKKHEEAQGCKEENLAFYVEAINKGDTKMLQFLIKIGATDVNHVHPEWGKTLLQVAVDRGSKPMMESLLACGADMTIKGKGVPPISMAKQKGFHELRDLLIAHSNNIDLAKDSKKKTEKRKRQAQGDEEGEEKEQEKEKEQEENAKTQQEARRKRRRSNEKPETPLSDKKQEEQRMEVRVLELHQWLSEHDHDGKKKYKGILRAKQNGFSSFELKQLCKELRSVPRLRRKKFYGRQSFSSLRRGKLWYLMRCSFHCIVLLNNNITIVLSQRNLFSCYLRFPNMEARANSFRAKAPLDCEMSARRRASAARLALLLLALTTCWGRAPLARLHHMLQLNLCSDPSISQQDCHVEGYVLPETIELLQGWSSEKPLRTICEIGVNGGHSASSLLYRSNPEAYWGFDLCAHHYVKSAFGFVEAFYPEVALHLICGDSATSVAEFHVVHPEITCDFAHVDGFHFLDWPLRDLFNFRAMMRPGSTVVMDDCLSVNLTSPTLLRDIAEMYPWRRAPSIAWEVVRHLGFLEATTQSTISCKGQWTKKAMNEGTREETVRAYADVMRTCVECRATPAETGFEDWSWASEEMRKALELST